MSKAKTLVIFGAGYVLGAQAGRARYEELKRQATRVAEHPKTKQLAQQAREKVGSRLPSSLSRRSGTTAEGGAAGSAGAATERPGVTEASTIDLTGDPVGTPGTPAADTSTGTTTGTTAGTTRSVGGPSHL